MFSLTGQTYSGVEAMEQILKPAVEYGLLEDFFFKVKTGLKVNERVYFLHTINKITRKGQGCNPDSKNTTIPRSEKLWNPEEVEARLDFCWKELKGHLEEKELKAGTDVSNIEGTKVEEYLLDLLVPAAYRDLMRMVWLSRKSITADDLTNGEDDVENYDQIDGFFKKITDAVGKGETPYVAIAKNSQSSAAAQQLAAGEAVTIMRAVIGKQKPLLRSTDKSQKVFYVTRSIYENYYDYLEGNDKLESARKMLIEGVEVLTYRGIPLVVLDVVDDYVESDFFVDGTFDKPNRVVLTAKHNFQIGVDTDTTNPIIMQWWYEKKERKVYFEYQYKLDCQIAEEGYVVAAY
ncbi:hypothetical protein [Larkinella arboricola]